MSQMKFKPPADSPNSSTWRDRAGELQDALELAESEKDELENRLSEIASIAAPDLNERAERIDQNLIELRQEQARMWKTLELISERLPGPEISGQN